MTASRKELLEKQIEQLTASLDGLDNEEERWEVDSQIQRTNRELKQLSKPHYVLAFINVCLTGGAVFLSPRCWDSISPEYPSPDLKITRSRETNNEHDMPQSPKLQWAINGFRWIVCAIDIASGLYFILMVYYLLFGHLRRSLFHVIPNECFGVLILGPGIWAVFSGVKLITEKSPVRWGAGKRRHLIAATLSGSIIVLAWLALLVDIVTAKYPPNGFDLAMSVSLFTIVFGCVAAYLLIVSLVMGRLNRQLVTEHQWDS